MLINLLNNAIKFTPAGAVTLEVRRAAGPGRVAFTITDTGVGMAPHELTALFAAFQQTEVGRQHQEGTGLGVAISQAFVELLGGELQVDSAVGRGTTFTFEIAAPEAAAATSRPGLEPELRPDPAETAHHKILVVDDKGSNRTILSGMLTTWGFVVREAEDGEAAVDQWRTWRPDLIFMDVRMPRLGGHDAIRRILQVEGGQGEEAGMYWKGRGPGGGSRSGWAGGWRRGCQGGWGRLLSVTNTVGAGSCCPGESGWATGWGPGGATQQRAPPRMKPCMLYAPPWNPFGAYKYCAPVEIRTHPGLSWCMHVTDSALHGYLYLCVPFLQHHSCTPRCIRQRLALEKRGTPSKLLGYFVLPDHQCLPFCSVKHSPFPSVLGFLLFIGIGVDAAGHTFRISTARCARPCYGSNTLRPCQNTMGCSLVNPVGGLYHFQPATVTTRHRF